MFGKHLLDVSAGIGANGGSGADDVRGTNAGRKQEGQVVPDKQNINATELRTLRTST